MRRRTETALLIAALTGAAAFGFSLVAAIRSGGSPGSPADVEPRLRVEILNGAGRPGLAENTTELARDGGLDVVFFGNADAFTWQRSVVIDRAGNPERARIVARVLGIDRIESDPVAELHLDATVVLGDDWEPVRKRSPTGLRARLGRLWRWLEGIARGGA